MKSIKEVSFDIGEVIWFMKNNKAKSEEVQFIEVYKENIFYGVFTQNPQKISYIDAFKSKPLLLASL